MQNGYDLPFLVGEELVYRVYWGIIPVAWANVTSEWGEENGRQVIILKFRTRTNKVLEKLYPVDDTLESVIDPATFLPYRFTKRLSEGNYRADQDTFFYHDKGYAIWTNNLAGDTKRFELEEDTRDIPSLMYSLRRTGFKVGDEHDYRVMADEKIYDLYVKAVKKKKVDLPLYGKVDCIELDPQAAFDGLFVRKGKMWIWISNDERVVCTKMVASVPVASVKIKLWEVEGPGDDFWTTALEEKKTDDQDDDEINDMW